MSTTVAGIPYERAVDIARSAEQLSPGERARISRYVVAWLALDDWILSRVVAELPEQVATAMLDLRLAPLSPEYSYSETGEPELAPEITAAGANHSEEMLVPPAPAAGSIYTWDGDCEPLLEVLS